MIALITDTHFGIKQNNEHFLEYSRKFCMDWFFPLLEDRNVKHIIHCGDLFDQRKLINFKTLNYVNLYFINQVVKRDMQLDGILGNHDVYYKNTNTVNSLQEIYGERFENINFYTYPKEKIIEGHKFLFYPWVSPENELEFYEIMEKSQADILIGHLDIPGFYVGEKQSDSGLPVGTYAHFDKVLTGHYHTRQSDKNVFYLGSPYETKWSEFGMVHGIHFLHEDGTLEFVKNPYSLYHKIIYRDEEEIQQDFSHIQGGFVRVIVENMDSAIRFDRFLEHLHSFDPASLRTIEKYQDIVTDEQVANTEDTMQLIDAYVDECDVWNKDKVKTVLQDLYRVSIDESYFS